MKTKKQRLLILALLLLAAPWLYANRLDVMRLVFRPLSPVADSRAIAAPDYRQQENWVAHPDKQDPSDLRPSGLPEVEGIAPVDTFYIHPTGYLFSSDWNSDMDPRRGAAQMTDLYLASQASAFNGISRVFAPEYRQATMYSFVDYGSDSGQQALELAYGDVLRAFDHFIEHENQGRPFIIASHSQGTGHALRLLEERLENSALKDRLVAAYLVGFQVPMDKFERSFPSLHPCRYARDTGCLISWDSFREGSSWIAPTPHWYKEGWEWATGKERLCVNPLSWQMDKRKAPVDMHLGALPLDMRQLIRVSANAVLDRNSQHLFTELPALLPEHTWARCSESGELYVERQAKLAFRAGEDLMGKGNYHLSDYGLFYRNIADNAAERVEAYLQRH